jgi:hypothetical protein
VLIRRWFRGADDVGRSVQHPLQQRIERFRPIQQLDGSQGLFHPGDHGPLQ